ncbi:MAG: cytochrome c3 family protein [Gemmatimonadales bacterium]
MARLGPPWSGRRGVGLVVVVLLLSAAVLIASPGPGVRQPIAFNHRKHTRDLGLNCEFCHEYVRVGAHAGLPDGQKCAICHSVPQGTSEEAARLTDLLSAGDSLKFNKLFQLPSHVFYTHRRHVGIAGLECENCHDGIADTERPPERPLVGIKMKFCLECHREREQTTDCVACHR